MACRRTFSDLTRTPAAYRKKIELWGIYAHMLAAGLSVRAAAQLLHVHPSTAFRWRHALLDEFRARDHERLSGWIELRRHWFAWSYKGSRNLERAPRRRGVRDPFVSDEPGQNVVLAIDRQGNLTTSPFGRPTTRLMAARAGSAAFIGAIAPHVAGPSIIVMDQGRFSMGGLLAVRLRAPFHDARLPRTRSALSANHVRNVRAYEDRLLVWLRRFRGVATRYLPNYLAWHVAVDRGFRANLRHLVLMWSIEGDSSDGRPPQTGTKNACAANNSCEQSAKGFERTPGTPPSAFVRPQSGPSTPYATCIPPPDGAPGTGDWGRLDDARRHRNEDE